MRNSVSPSPSPSPPRPQLTRASTALTDSEVRRLHLRGANHLFTLDSAHAVHALRVVHPVERPDDARSSHHRQGQKDLAVAPSEQHDRVAAERQQEAVPAHPADALEHDDHEDHGVHDESNQAHEERKLAHHACFRIGYLDDPVDDETHGDQHGDHARDQPRLVWVRPRDVVQPARAAVDGVHSDDLGLVSLHLVRGLRADHRGLDDGAFRGGRLVALEPRALLLWGQLLKLGGRRHEPLEQGADAEEAHDRAAHRDVQVHLSGRPHAVLRLGLRLAPARGIPGAAAGTLAAAGRLGVPVGALQAPSLREGVGQARPEPEVEARALKRAAAALLGGGPHAGRQGSERRRAEAGRGAEAHGSGWKARRAGPGCGEVGRPR
mmetsp:Transcript_64464/g.188606  ORF Transcript_64464/g.188606 Transcript_64464/m.188606 type:complete len:379 (-) Transcript_64464:11-1147(-)